MPRPYNASHKKPDPKAAAPAPPQFIDPAIVHYAAAAPPQAQQFGQHQHQQQHRTVNAPLPAGIVSYVTQAPPQPRYQQQAQQVQYAQPVYQQVVYQQQVMPQYIVPAAPPAQPARAAAQAPAPAAQPAPRSAVAPNGIMCTGCKQLFPDPDSLATHMTVANHGFWHNCRAPNCGWCFVTGALLQQHMATNHAPTAAPAPAAHSNTPSYVAAAQQAPRGGHGAQPFRSVTTFNAGGAAAMQQPVHHQEARKTHLNEGNLLNRDSKKTYDAIVKAFIENDEEGELQFPPTLTAEERHHVHKLCMHYQLEHASTGAGASRQLKIWKPHFVPKAVDGGSPAADPLVGRAFNGFSGAQPLNDEYLADHLEDVRDLVAVPVSEMQNTLLRRLEHDMAANANKKVRPQQPGAWFSGAHPGRSDKGPEHHAQLQQFRQRLPSYTMKSQIIDAVRANRVTVVSGETGCGKTTQLPQILYEEGLGREICPEVRDGGMILCTQPRRVSAISVSQRVAEERGEKCGGVVGYSIRFENVASAATRVLYMTTGILLRKLHSDPELKGVAAVILDEVHERDVDTDFALLLLRDLVRAKGSKLRLIVMSATIQVEKLVAYFTAPRPAAPPPLIAIPGSLFPVKEYWLDDALQWLNLPPEAVPAMAAAIEAAKRRVAGPDAAGSAATQSSYDALKSAALENLDKVQVETIVPVDVICGIIEAYHRDQPKGNAILVFLPGWAAIDKVMNILRAKPNGLAKELSILPLHSTLTTAEQQRVFLPAPKNFRKVVLSTNIAETSVTIDDIVLVIDSGLLKGTSYDPAGNTSSLTSQLIAKANGHQRRGRAGRVRAGVCVHLLPRATYDALPAFLLPEMQRTALEEICLQVKAIVDNDTCVAVLSKALDAPPMSSIKHAVTALTAMGALDSRERLTALGRVLATIPMHPSLGKMLLLGASLGVFDPLCTLAAALSAKSPFVRPMPHQMQDAKAAQSKFEGTKQSDHLAVLELYSQWSRSHRRSDFAFANWADHTVLNGMERMRTQLRRLLDHSGYLKHSTKPGWENRYRTNDALIRFALTHSLVPRVAVYERDYRGRQDNIFCWDNKPCTFHLGSSLARTKLRFFNGREFFVYYDRMRIESQLQLFDATALSRTSFILAAKTLTASRTAELSDDALLDPHSKFCAWDHVPSDVAEQLPVTLSVDGGKKRFAVSEATAAALLAVHDTVNFFFSLAMQRMDVTAVPDSVVCALATALGDPARPVEPAVATAGNGTSDDAASASTARLGPSPNALPPPRQHRDSDDDDEALEHAPEVDTENDDDDGAAAASAKPGSTDVLLENALAARQLTEDQVEILVRAFGDLSWISRRAMPSSGAAAPSAPLSQTPAASSARATEVTTEAAVVDVEYSTPTVNSGVSPVPTPAVEDDDDGDEVIAVAMHVHESTSAASEW